VHCGLAAADRVVVHRGEIVMDERIAMHALDGGCRMNGDMRGDIEQRRALDQKKRPQALAGAENAVTHGRNQPRRRAARQFCVHHGGKSALHEMRR
jgi:hypothetical protein